MSPRLILHEIIDRADPNLPDWLDAISTGFPPDQQMLPGYFLRLLAGKEISHPDTEPFRMVAALDADGTLLGAFMYEMLPQVHACCLWYLWVNRVERSRGLGSELYLALIDLARRDDPALRALVFEVERPDMETLPERRDLARRRMHFYQRLGARICSNIFHLQTVGRDDQPSRLMYVCAHALAPMDDLQLLQVMETAFIDIAGQVSQAEWFGAV